MVYFSRFSPAFELAGFDDDRYFYSTRKIYENDVIYNPQDISEYYHPFLINTKVGDIKIGVILCEDMWWLDYPYNPTKILVENGAEIIFNLSASPWTWQKNRKRHQVVKDLFAECAVPFVYVNNTGIQNTGKNIIVFDNWILKLLEGKYFLPNNFLISDFLKTFKSPLW